MPQPQMPQPPQPADRRAVRRGRPRRRFTDLVEDVAAWMLASAGAFLLVAAILGGFAVHAATSERGQTEQATLTAAQAVLLENAPIVRAADGGPVSVRVEAVWTGPDGLSQTGPVPVTSPSTAGSTVRIWLDRDGRAVSRPAGEAEAVCSGIVVGVGLLLVGGSLLLSCWIGVRHLTGRVNSARWEREWERIGPEWSRDTRP